MAQDVSGVNWAVAATGPGQNRGRPQHRGRGAQVRDGQFVDRRSGPGLEVHPQAHPGSPRCGRRGRRPNRFPQGGVRQLPADVDVHSGADVPASGPGLPVDHPADQGGRAQPHHPRGDIGFMVLFWQYGHGSEAIFGIHSTGAVTFWIPLMVFAFLFGLSMDYEVFILSRIREPTAPTSPTPPSSKASVDRPPGHQRGADTVPRLRGTGLRPRHRPEDLRLRPRIRDPARRHHRSINARARPGIAVRQVELVAAPTGGSTASNPSSPDGSGDSLRLTAVTEARYSQRPRESCWSGRIGREGGPRPGVDDYNTHRPLPEVALFPPEPPAGDRPGPRSSPAADDVCRRHVLGGLTREYDLVV